MRCIRAHADFEILCGVRMNAHPTRLSAVQPLLDNSIAKIERKRVRINRLDPAVCPQLL